MAKDDALYEGEKIAIETPDPAQISPEQIDRGIEVFSNVLLPYGKGAVMQRVLNERFPDFKPATTYEDEGRVVHSSGIPDDARKVDEIKQRLPREDEAVAGGGEQIGRAHV